MKDAWDTVTNPDYCQHLTRTPFIDSDGNINERFQALMDRRWEFEYDPETGLPIRLLNATLSNNTPPQQSEMNENIPQELWSGLLKCETYRIQIDALVNFLEALLPDEQGLREVGYGELACLMKDLAVHLKSNGMTDMTEASLGSASREILTEEQRVAFVRNWNAQVAQGMGEVVRNCRIMAQTDKIARDLGYESAGQMVDEERPILLQKLDAMTGNVCNKVIVSFKQTVSLSREAFEATLKISNGNGTAAMTDIVFEPLISDERGNLVDLSKKFALRQVTTDNLTGESILEGGMQLAASSSGLVTLHLVPGAEAAGETVKYYRFAGLLHYIDPFDGHAESLSVGPVMLEVHPAPRLTFDYFVQRDVCGDDPFTRDEVEPSVPAEIAVLIRNSGYGAAKNVTIKSAEPAILENENGVAIDFELISNGTALNGNAAQLPLRDVSLGDVPAQGVAVAQWWLNCNLQGRFKSVDASFTHVTDYGKTEANMSLVEDVREHLLVRSIVADDDDMPDFLVTEWRADRSPDLIYTTRGLSLEVFNSTVKECSINEDENGAVARIAVQVSASGWNFTRCLDPMNGRGVIERVTRLDGTEVPLRNVWLTDRTFHDGQDVVWENCLNLVDTMNRGDGAVYEIHYLPVPEDVVAVSGFNGIENGAVFDEAPNAVTVSFNKPIDPSTFNVLDLQLWHQGKRIEDISALSIMPVSAMDFIISGFSRFGLSLGTYTMTVQCAEIFDQNGISGRAGKTLMWSVHGNDHVPPTLVDGLKITPDLGGSSTDGTTCGTDFHLVGSLSEDGLAVRVSAERVDGQTIELWSDIVADSSLDVPIRLISGGVWTIVVELVDVAGNKSESCLPVFIDTLPLSANLVGVPGEDGVMNEITLAFSDAVVDGDVTLAKFVLTRNGETVDLSGDDGGVGHAALPTLTAHEDGKTYTLKGLAALCSADGDYVLSFAAADVRKRSSGLRAVACAPLAWRYVCPDREPPTIASVRIDGEEVRGVYTNGIASVEIAFSEDVNLLDLSQKGLIGQALKVQLLDADSNVTGTVCAVQADVVCEADGLTWTLPADAVPAGFARLVVDGGLVADTAGNRLAADASASANGLQGFAFKSDVVATADAYAMPTWYDFDGDGLGDLVVGEKTAAGEGKVRVYRNLGTSAEPRFGAFTYLKVGGSDLSIAGGGCQGAQVAFGDLTGDGNDDLIVGYANGRVQMWRGTATRGVYGEGEALLSGAEPTYGSDRAFVCPYDLDGDGRLELVVGGMDGRFRVLRYAAGGGSAESWLMGANGAPLAVAAGRSTPVLADVNGDGCVDVLTGDTAGSVWAFLGDGRAWCAAAVPVFDNAAAKLPDRSRIGYGDVNGDGVGDLLVGRADGSVELALGVKTAAPAFAFRVVRTLDAPFAVEIEGETGNSAFIVIDPEWARETFGAETTDAEVAELLNGTGANGIKVWQSLVLGLDPADPTDRFLVDVPQNGETGAVAVEALDGTLREDLGVTVEYRFRRDGETTQEGTELAIRLDGADDPTGVYSVTAVFVDGEGAEFAEIPAENRIGVLRRAGAAKREIVPVPWKAFAQEKMDIAVSNLVKTAELAAGDRLYVYDDAEDLYDTWELRADKTWKPVKTVKMVKGELEVQEADSPEVATVRRGTGVWLERNDVSKPIHLIGQYEAAAAEVRIEAGTADAPKWNLVASPLLGAWDLNAVCEGVNAADRIIVPTGGEPRIYTRGAANAKWGYIVYEVDARGVVKPVRKEGDTVLGPGTGFWYVSEGGAPTIKWNEAKEER